MLKILGSVLSLEVHCVEWEYRVFPQFFPADTDVVPQIMQLRRISRLFNTPCSSVIQQPCTVCASDNVFE